MSNWLKKKADPLLLSHNNLPLAKKLTNLDERKDFQQIRDSQRK